MREISRWRGQYDFAIRRQFDLTRVPSGVHQRYSADFRVVLCRDHNLLHGRQVAITARKLGTIFVKDYLIVIWLNPAWLESCRPDLTALDIAQEYIGAPIITCRIFPPAGDSEVSPANNDRSTAVGLRGSGYVAMQIVAPQRA